MQLENVESFYPLTPLQQGILFHSVAEPTSRMYFNQTLMTLGGELDVERFRRAFETVVERHAILRTFFVWEGVEAPVQVVEKSVDLPFEVRDWTGLSPDEREARIEELRRADLERGFDLKRAPLLRVFLLRTSPTSTDLLWTFHHILLDGWSMFRVLSELFALYDGRPLGPVPRAYRDHVAWLHRQDRSRAEAFWRERLAGLQAPTPLPYEASPGSTSDEEEFATLPLALSRASTAALTAFAREQRITLNTILQASWALTLARFSGHDDVVFGSVVSGRPPELDGVEAMVGLFINTLPVRVAVEPAERVAAWLQRLQAESADLRELEFSPLTEVQAWSPLPAGTSLFDTIFMFENYQKDAELEDLSQSLAISDVRWFERHNYPIAALALPADELVLRIIYRTERLSEATIARVLKHWRTLLEGLVAAPDAQLADLPLVEPGEERELALQGNDTRTDYPRDATIHALFARQVAATPDAPAVSFGPETLTYAELDRRVNRLARRLQRDGVGPEVCVGLCLERSIDLVVAIVAILKAGGAYVALDPDYPEERLAFMIADSAAPVLVTTSSLVAKLPEGHAARVVCLDRERDALVAEDATSPEVDVRADGLAYVIYTSGSTGRPKGTEIPHRAVVRLVQNTNFVDVRPDDVFGQFATVSFDASTLELWAPLLNGARLAVFPPGPASADELGRTIREQGVTVLWLTAGLFHRMIDEALESLRGLRVLIAGGDVLSVPHVRRALAELGCEVVNGYGPTENTTFTCCHRMDRETELGDTVPIGRPIANTTVYLLDDRLRPVPAGVTGSLYTGGDGLARGYHGRPELTAAAFLPDPFAPEPGARMYRTGDRARCRADGTIEFLGRADFQVKIRGYRIELGEIEHALAEHPLLGDTIVLARDDGGQSKALVAYATRAGGDPKTDELRAFLSERLPDHMLPSAFVLLDRFPLTANGKVDRKALPAPGGARPELATAFAAPAEGAEAKIATVWSNVLGLDRVGATDNFFDLGGNSLAMIQAHTQLNEALGRELRMVDLFQHPTVRALARFVEGDAGAADSARASEATAEKLEAGRSRLQRLQQRRRRS